MRKIRMIVLILIAIGVIGGLALAVLTNRPQKPTEIDFANLPPNVTVGQEVLTVAYTREEMIDYAEVIFVGKVLSISPTFWNQDSGEYWYDDESKAVSPASLQLHAIEFEVLRVIVDTLGIEKRVTIYVYGPSPLDGGTTLEDGITIRQAEEEDYEMAVGDQVIFFAGQTELAWREG